MKQEIILQLNQLNKDFYQKIASDFHQTRQQPWAGWAELLPVIREQFSNQTDLRVLDIGCGNGRFGEYLAQHLPTHEISYTGIDSSDFLLEKAEEKLETTQIQFHLDQVDIIEALLHDQEWLPANSQGHNPHFDLVVAFGVIHHVPSLALREKFVKRCIAVSEPKGVVVIAAWQFDQTNQLLERAVPAEEVGLSSSDLEENDFILPWERGEKAYRYCHLPTADELQNLLPPGITTINFWADGKQNHSNLYSIIKK